MGLTDRFKELKGKAEDAAAEHNDQIRGAIQKAASTADQKTGGKYREKIEQAGARADTFVGGLKDPATPAAGGEQPTAAPEPAAAEPTAGE